MFGVYIYEIVTRKILVGPEHLRECKVEKYLSRQYKIKLINRKKNKQFFVKPDV